MNSLILDCSAGMNVLLLADEKEYSFFDNSERKHSDDLLIVIDDLLKKAKIKAADLNNICVCTGPGSFTGLRVAISVCKGFAVESCANVFALSNLDVYEFNKTKNAILVLDGFSQFIYVRKFEDGNNLDACISINDLKNIIMQNKFEIYTTNEKVQNKLKSNEIIAKNAKYNLKNAFFKKISNGEKIEINQIMPIYLRASQAEIERNKKLSGE